MLTRQESEVEITEQQSAKVGKVRYAAGFLNRPHQGQEHDSPHEILGLDTEGQREHHDFALAVEHAERNQQTVNTARSANRGRPFRGEPEDVGIAHRHRGEAGCNCAEKIKLQKSLRSPITLDLRTEHPQRQCVKKKMQQLIVEEGIGDQLPDHPVNYKAWGQGQVIAHPRMSDGRGNFKDRHQQVNSRVNQDQALHPTRERRQAQRDRTSAIHRHTGASTTARERILSIMVSGCTIGRAILSSCTFFVFFFLFSCFLVLAPPPQRTYRSGTGTTGKLRCPCASIALTAKMTLSLESFKVVRVTFPTFSTCSHSGLEVRRQRIS